MKEYWNAMFQRPELFPRYDLWLDKYAEQLAAGSGAIVDLGCGLGNNSVYLVEKGMQPLACDISEEALHRLKSVLPECVTYCFDMTKGLPFEDQSVKVLIADLSLHYFDAQTTIQVIQDIHRVLTESGLLLCRLNSIHEMGNVGEVKESTDSYLFENEGIFRRFFNRDEIQRFFTNEMWEFVHMEEYELDRYENKKVLWEIALRPKRASGI
nr:class I SAM-dependent methyltransferase [Paenibacillus turpanensis]